LLARLKRDSRVARPESGSGLNLGLQIGTQFCPGVNDRQTASAVPPQGIAGKQIEFFCGLKTGAGRWFFDIYIQGSKYNFKS